jgi:hypothetical protein
MDGSITYFYRHKRGQGKECPQTIPTDVMVLDKHERQDVYCQGATDCTPTSIRNIAVLPSHS